MESLASPDVWIALLTLTAMEIVLGIDNIVFISILVARVPTEQREVVRKVGLMLALVMRLGLLFALTWLMGLTATLFTVFGNELSGRDLILLAGGLFLIAKAVHEMHEKLEGAGAPPPTPSAQRGAVAAVLAQIIVIDIVFSLDSVITAVGMAQQLWVMIAAMIISVIVMLIFAKAIGDFVEAHPTVKILALSFLVLIGVVLVADGLGQHIAKGYIYFAMAFALGVEVVNMRMRKKSAAVHLHSRFEAEPPPPAGPSPAG